MKLILMVGLPACGKSTLSKDLKEYTILNTDSIRKEIYGREDILGSAEWGEFYKRLVFSIGAGENVVLDNTNIRAKDRKMIYEMTKLFSPAIELWIFDVKLETCLERNANRSRVVPEEVMLRMARTLQENQEDLRIESKNYNAKIVMVNENERA